MAIIHNDLSLRGAQPAGLSPAPTTREAASRLRDLGRLIASTLLIAIGALILAIIVTTACYVGLFAFLGPYQARDILADLEFDYQFKQRLYALAVSLLYAGLIAATISAAAIGAREGWKARLALKKPRRHGAVWLIVVSTLLYGLVASGLLEHLRERHLVIDGPTDFKLIAAVCLNLVVLAPLAEELLFRGWIYTGLRRHLTSLSSLIITTALFAAIHWDANHRRFLIVMPLGLMLALLRELSGSVRPTIVLHAAYNLTVIVVTLLQV